MTYDIITIGAAVRDVFLVSKQIKLLPSEKFLTGVGECVALGTKIELDHLVLSTGGGATNAAATFGNLGFKTAAVARIGDDAIGEEIMADLLSYHITTELLSIIKGGKSGYSTLLTDPKTGERTALVYRGVSGELTEKDLSLKSLRADWLYLTSFGGNMKLAAKIINKLGPSTLRHGSGPSAKIVWNPGAADLKAGFKTFEPLLPKLFMLNVNMEEAQMLFGNEIRIPSSLLLVVTDGEKGAYAHLNGTTWFIMSQKKRVVSRTGAGDAFGSGMVAALMKGWGVDDAMRLGLMNAESVIEHYGAKAGLLKKWPNQKTLRGIKVTEPCLPADRSLSH